MPGKKKKSSGSSKKTGKAAPGKKKTTPAAAHGRNAGPTPARREFLTQTTVFGGRTRSVTMEILKKETYKSRGRKFSILTLKNEKRKLLAFHVHEITKEEVVVLHQLEMALAMKNVSARPEDVPGYVETLVMIKRSIGTYTDKTLNNVKRFLWSQFGASIEMLQRAIKQWPDEEWQSDKRFFYNAYHALVFLDYYLTDPAIKFTAFLPFTLTDMEKAPPESLDDVVPDRIYSKEELLQYADILYGKCRAVIFSLTESRLGDRWVEKDGDMNYGWLEILLYNMRHVQHHAAQLNMLLRQKINHAPGWIGRAKEEL